MNISLGKQCGVLQRTSGWSPWRPLPCAGSRNCEIWRKTRERGRRGERPAARGAFLPPRPRNEQHGASARLCPPVDGSSGRTARGGAVWLLEGPFPVHLRGMFWGLGCSTVCPSQAGCCV